MANGLKGLLTHEIAIAQLAPFPKGPTLQRLSGEGGWGAQRQIFGAQVFAAHRRVARQEQYCLIILATDGSKEVACVWFELYT